jgi:hypothetical protein
MARDPLEVLRRSRRNPLAPWGGAGTFEASPQRGETGTLEENAARAQARRQASTRRLRKRLWRIP